MPNPIDLSDYEDVTVLADIQSVKELLDEMVSYQFPKLYHIEEYNPPEDKGKQKYYSSTRYDIYNLNMEIEDGIVYCDGYLDNEDTTLLYQMVENDIIRVLNMFAIDDIIMIGIINKVITISTSFGYIRISY